MQTLTSTLLPWLATYALHSTALIGLVWLLVRWLPGESNRAQEWLWRGALLGPLLTASLHSGLQINPALGHIAWPALQPNKAQGAIVAAIPGHVESPDPWATAIPVAALRFESDPEPEAAFETANTFAFDTALESDPEVASGEVSGWTAGEQGHFEPLSEPVPVPPIATIDSATTWHWPSTLFWAWTIGGAIGLILLVRAWSRLMDRISGRRELTAGPLLETLSELCERAGRKRIPRLCVSPKIGSPATVGIWRSQICVPELAQAGLSSGQ